MPISSIHEDRGMLVDGILRAAMSTSFALPGGEVAVVIAIEVAERSSHPKSL